MPTKSSAESVSNVEQPAGRVLNSIPTISRGKGKKRALSQSEEAVTNIIRDPGLAGPTTLKVKKVKRAETRQCPICSEHIPVRLLEAHCELEMQRTEEIIRAVGSSEVYGDSVDGAQFSRARRSAVRAQKAFTQFSSGHGPASQDATARTEKMIKTVKRRRKQRYHRLREMIQGHDGDARCGGGGGGGEVVCPVCLETVFGDPDVAEAHVDACLVHAMPSVHERSETDLGRPSRTRATDGANLTASGFHVRDTNHEDVEDEIDVDGDDEEVFGRAQFTEVDILSASRSMSSSRKSETPIEIEAPGPSVPLAKHPSLESQPEPSNPALTCRICLDPYTEPTVSTQCWHTCCRECWLRCLESRLCPICKRITTASDLRRIYL
ncbi:hypothetical protein BJ322DRAFT_1099605 [Thelephora terrestris]|uniref:RING-type domain-containing protein n=1 Tax=Thelephora terrestris TaxID=56493 RepID=A0A9P6HGH1_9AGAM|nr:hypothetical protein BJ322DRAFT_1099605 [Thelephora terrestris]